jgi:hypothetical protein
MGFALPGLADITVAPRQTRYNRLDGVFCDFLQSVTRKRTNRMWHFD